MGRSGIVRLPIERLLQLKEIAKVRRVTVADLIGEFISSEAGRAGIKDQTPTFKISFTGIRILFEVDDLSTFRVSAGQVRELAEIFQQIGNRGGSRLIVIEAETLRIARKGRGVILEVTHSNGTKSKRTIAPSISRDLARQLRSFLQRS